MLRNEQEADSEKDVLLAIADFVQEKNLSDNIFFHKKGDKEYLNIGLEKHMISLSMYGRYVEIEFQFKPTLLKTLRFHLNNLRGESNNQHQEVNSELGERSITLAHTLKTLVKFINSKDGPNRIINIYPSDQRRKKYYLYLLDKMEDARVNVF